MKSKEIEALVRAYAPNHAPCFGPARMNMVVVHKDPTALAKTDAGLSILCRCGSRVKFSEHEVSNLAVA